MVRKSLFISALICQFLFGGYNLIAQPALDGFHKGQGNLDVVPGISVDNFSNYYGRLNETTSIKRTSFSGNIYTAYGITQWLDVQVNVPYVYVNDKFNGLQDFAGFVKASLFSITAASGNSFRFMLSGGTSFPMSDYETESQFAIGQQATAYDGRVIMQWMRSDGFFIMGQGGYTNRLDPVASSYPAAIKVGWARAERYIDIWYDQQIAIDGNDYLDYRQEIQDNGSTDITFQSLGVSYGKLGATYYRPLKGNSGVSFGASYVLWGRNVGQTVMLSAAYIKRFSFGGK